MSKISAAVGISKLASTFVVASGAGTLIKTATKMVIPVVATGKFATYKKISVSLGAAALGGLTADATSKYLHSQIDDYVSLAATGAGWVAEGAEALEKKIQKSDDENEG